MQALSHELELPDIRPCWPQGDLPSLAEAW